LKLASAINRYEFYSKMKEDLAGSVIQKDAGLQQEYVLFVVSKLSENIPTLTLLYHQLTEELIL